VPLLIRTWNLFHGNSVPPERNAYLEDAVRLARADGPDILCLQEVPVWALERLGEWSGMTVFGAVAAPPRLGPLPASAELGRRITALHHGVLRSAFTGQANAILLAPWLTALDSYGLELNDRRFRKTQARALGLDLVGRLAWAKERRVCHAVRVRTADGTVVFVANLHATGLPDDRLSDAEVLRAASFADGLARRGELCVLAGDLNARAGRSRTLAELVGAEWGFSTPGPKVDHVLVRGAAVEGPAVWPAERRRVRGRLLSDHAPVEVRVR
jgi:endonuclease/exonuclease/phosphatase family metal-dependent hydrolase